MDSDGACFFSFASVFARLLLSSLFHFGLFLFRAKHPNGGVPSPDIRLRIVLVCMCVCEYFIAVHVQSACQRCQHVIKCIGRTVSAFRWCMCLTRPQQLTNSTAYEWEMRDGDGVRTARRTNNNNKNNIMRKGNILKCIFYGKSLSAGRVVAESNVWHVHIMN